MGTTETESSLSSSRVDQRIFFIIIDILESSCLTIIIENSLYNFSVLSNFRRLLKFLSFVNCRISRYFKAFYATITTQCSKLKLINSFLLLLWVLSFHRCQLIHVKITEKIFFSFCFMVHTPLFTFSDNLRILKHEF